MYNEHEEIIYGVAKYPMVFSYTDVRKQAMEIASGNSYDWVIFSTLDEAKKIQELFYRPSEHPIVKVVVKYFFEEITE